MKFNQTLETIIDINLKNGHVPFLVGEVGIGKSSYLQALAQKYGTKCFTLACNQLADKADLTGARPTELEQTNDTLGKYKMSFFPHEVIFDAIAYAYDHPDETPILFMDELNRTTPDVTSEALSIPTMRQIGSTKLPHNLKVVIAGNDKGNITALDSASINRFVVIPVEPDTETFLNLHKNTLNPYIKEVLAEHPEVIFCKSLPKQTSSDDDDDNSVYIEDIVEDVDEMKQITSPRSITHLSEFLNSCDESQLLSWCSETTSDNSTVLFDIISGYVGTTLFSNYLFEKYMNRLTSQTNNTSQQTVVLNKPICYDHIITIDDIDDMRTYISSRLTENEREQLLLYTLTQNASDVTNVIVSICAEDITALQPNTLIQFITAKQQMQFDDDMVETFLDQNTALTNTLKTLLTNSVI